LFFWCNTGKEEEDDDEEEAEEEDDDEEEEEEEDDDDVGEGSEDEGWALVCRGDCWWWGKKLDFCRCMVS